MAFVLQCNLKINTYLDTEHKVTLRPEEKFLLLDI